MINNKLTYPILTAFILMIVVTACKKDQDAPHNPYDSIDYGNDAVLDTTDPRSFYGLHKNIFSVKCANPGCHDGNFEPDFRSVQSSYSTLVYHSVIKQLSPWNYRVVPYDTAGSWLWQRLQHQEIISGTDTSEGRMPLYSPKLSQDHLDNISHWIMNGAKDAFGQPATYPNTEPTLIYYVATNAAFQPIDTNRDAAVYNPFKVDSALNFKIVIQLEDDSTAVSNFSPNILKLSSDFDDFSSAVTYTNGVYLTFQNTEYWTFDISATGFAKNDTVFMRYYTNDGDHVTNFEYPRSDMLFPYKTWWSFIVQ